MAQLQVQHLRKEFGENIVLEDVSFTISHGDKVGVVGANGCGKSTLMRILAGAEEADGGVIYRDKKMVLRVMEQGHFNDQQMAEAAQLQMDGEELREESMFLLMMALNREKAQQPEILSGGERTKLNLSRTMAGQANLLLLDEPTNNLDDQGVQTFIYLLSEFGGTVLMVSHDRYLLDQTVDKILEIEAGRAEIYQGNYSAYRAEKKRRREEEMHRYQADKKQQRQVEEAMRELRSYSEKAHRDSTKASSNGLKMGEKEKKRAKAKKMDQRIKSGIKRLEKMRQEAQAPPGEEKKVMFSIAASQGGGKRILEAEGLSKSYGDVKLFENSDFYLCRGEKAALTGPNGCGKSTLIRILEGKVPADAGEVWISPGSNPYILRQTFDELPGKETVFDYLECRVGSLKGLERTILHNMGITKRHLFQRIRTLSYGEQMKLKLVQPILEKRDFIILDEPTNHLDLFAREQLEETLREYDGTLLIVSHDRYFLEHVCDKMLVVEGQKISRRERLEWTDPSGVLTETSG